jgi:hypothetical protein
MPRWYHTDKPRFDSGAQQSLVIAQNFIAYRGSRCAVTMEGSVYCINRDNADSQMMTTGYMGYRGSQAQTIS